ncbi:MAG TPA: hypothetical protein VOA41_12015 [Candidatus Dormibacteraeota bacterium]|nr:hypothetical protein [Candidatus Dormibacteraeota bacterium]
MLRKLTHRKHAVNRISRFGPETAFAEIIGNMIEHADGSGEFTSVTLHPVVTIADESRAGELAALHSRAHSLCFIARSVCFPLKHVPTILRQ